MLPLRVASTFCTAIGTAVSDNDLELLPLHVFSMKSRQMPLLYKLGMD